MSQRKQLTSNCVLRAEWNDWQENANEAHSNKANQLSKYTQYAFRQSVKSQ